MSPSSKAQLIRHSAQIKRQIAFVKEQKRAPVSLMWARRHWTLESTANLGVRLGSNAVRLTSK